MAWQSLSGMGPQQTSNGGGNGGGEGSQQVNQPQGTEYTLQGNLSSLNNSGNVLMASRCYALPPN